MTEGTAAPSFPIPRRAVLSAAVGVAAIAAIPAQACVYTSRGLYPRSFYTDARARIFLDALLEHANGGRAPGSIQPPSFEIVEGERTFSSFEAQDWVVSHGRRDRQPVRLEAMTRIGRRPHRLVFMVALERSQYLLARDGNSCDAGHDEGYRRMLQAWLYVFAPNSASTLQRLPTLDDSIFALVDGIGAGRTNG